jgi:hypothetical protein
LNYEKKSATIKSLDLNGRGPDGEEAALKAVARKGCRFESCPFRFILREIIDLKESAILMEEHRISKDQKFQAARELVASYLRGEGGKNVSPDQIGPLFMQVFKSVDETLPEPEKRRIGLGID